MAATVANAEWALTQIPALRAAGEAATKALITFLERFDDIHRLADEIRASGATGWPSSALFRVNVSRSLQATLHTRGLSTEALPPPASRVDLNRLLQSWASNLEASLGRTLEDAA